MAKKTKSEQPSQEVTSLEKVTSVEKVTSRPPAKQAVKPKAVKKEVSSKKSAPVNESTPVVEVATDVPVTSVTSVNEKVVVEPTLSLTEDFSKFMTHMQQLSSMLGSLRTEFRVLEKKATRELKSAQKATAKRKRKAGNRSPSGFVKPTLISNELASFLGKEIGTEMARTDVTREINTYIRAHKLQDPTNGRKINADSQLSSLLKLTPSDELTYFNLQKFMSPHFQKQSDKVALGLVSA